MSHFKEVPAYFSGLRLLTVDNVAAAVPQNIFTFKSMIGIDRDGESVKVFDLKTELEGKYFVLIFLPMDFTCDSEEVLSLKASLESFDAEGCQVFSLRVLLLFESLSNVSKVFGVTADSPLATTRWIRFNIVRSRRFTRITFISTLTGRACLMVDLAALQASQFSVTRTFPSQQAAASPGSRSSQTTPRP